MKVSEHFWLQNEAAGGFGIFAEYRKDDRSIGTSAAVLGRPPISQGRLQV
jgi:hypothetical protein